MADEEEQISFRIIRVKDISFNINENFFKPEKTPNDIKITINCELKTNVEVDFIIIEINSFYHYHPDLENQLASITVQNAFNVPNLRRFNNDDKLLLPHSLLITLVSISLSHTRALFSKSIGGSAFNDMVMPIINPDEFTRSVLPQMFDGTGMTTINSDELNAEKSVGN